MRSLFVFAALLLIASCNTETKKENNSDPIVEVQEDNTLSEKETAEGWLLLFDGKSMEAWKNFNEDTISGWIIEDGCIVGLGLGGDIGGDIVTKKEYSEFILKWEWKLGAHGNSGVFYHAVEAEKYNAPYETAPEYQLIEDDDFREPDGSKYELEEWQKTGADYAMHLPDTAKKKVNIRGWNTSMIKYTAEKAEYWLNGEKLLEFVPYSEDWTERRNSGKWEAFPDYAISKTGKIGLQDHGSKVWFKNIKIKAL